MLFQGGAVILKRELFQSEAEQRQPKLKFLASCESLSSVQFKSCNRPSNLKYLKVDDVLK